MSTPNAEPTTLERRPDRWVLLGAMATLLVASWAWLLFQAWAMAHMDIVEMAMPSLGPWGPADFWLVFVMWTVMMVAMMVPSVVPVVLLYQRVVVGREASASLAAARTALFLSGYVLAWTLFSAAATAAQWALHGAALISPVMRVRAPAVGGAVLILAGAYQWTPLKHVCLAHCRSPLAFLLDSWRDGKTGALAMGLAHGFYCTACCWLLMAILFAVGVMNFAWIVALTAFVLAEKLLPHGERFARAAGIALVAWGAWLMLAR